MSNAFEALSNLQASSQQAGPTNKSIFLDHAQIEDASELNRQLYGNISAFICNSYSFSQLAIDLDSTVLEPKVAVHLYQQAARAAIQEGNWELANCLLNEVRLRGRDTLILRMALRKAKSSDTALFSLNSVMPPHPFQRGHFSGMLDQVIEEFKFDWSLIARERPGVRILPLGDYLVTLVHKAPVALQIAGIRENVEMAENSEKVGACIFDGNLSLQAMKVASELDSALMLIDGEQQVSAVNLAAFRLLYDV